MIFNPRSRRQFLTGASKLGLLMPVPLLPSLMPRSTWGAPISTPLRLVQCISAWGQFNKPWFPTFPSLDVVDAGTGAKGAKLASLPGSVSQVIGPAFDTLKGKMNLIKGLDVQAESYGHNQGLANCASGANDKYGTYILLPISMEYILTSSPKIYPDASAGAVKYIGVSLSDPMWAVYAWDYSWVPSGKKLGILTDLKAVYSKFARSFNAASSTTTAIDPAQADRIKLVQEVHQDYQSVVSSGRLASADRPRLEQYMQLVAEVEKSLSAPVKSCADPKPTSLDGPVNQAQWNDLAKIVGAALACQLTRVVDYVFDSEGTSVHGYQHKRDLPNHTAAVSSYGKKIAALWTTLDSLKDPDGNTVLDNSIAYWSSNTGMADESAHTYSNLPLLTAGSGGGRLQTGYFVDFKSRPYNNWPIAIFTAMGLGPSD